MSLSHPPSHIYTPLRTCGPWCTAGNIIPANQHLIVLPWNFGTSVKPDQPTRWWPRCRRQKKKEAYLTAHLIDVTEVPDTSCPWSLTPPARGP